MPLNPAIAATLASVLTPMLTAPKKKTRMMKSSVQTFQWNSLIHILMFQRPEYPPGRRHSVPGSYLHNGMVMGISQFPSFLLEQ
jgi:hypothetical protein